MKKLVVGQVVYAVFFDRQELPSDIEVATVVFVGRKCFDVKLPFGGVEKKIPIETMMTGHESDPHYKIFLSLESYDDFNKRKELNQRIWKYFYNGYKAEYYTTEELEQIAKFIKT